MAEFFYKGGVFTSILVKHTWNTTVSMSETHSIHHSICEMAAAATWLSLMNIMKWTKRRKSNKIPEAIDIRDMSEPKMKNDTGLKK